MVDGSVSSQLVLAVAARRWTAEGLAVGIEKVRVARLLLPLPEGWRGSREPSQSQEEHARVEQPRLGRRLHSLSVSLVLAWPATNASELLPFVWLASSPSQSQ